MRFALQRWSQGIKSLRNGSLLLKRGNRETKVDATESTGTPLNSESHILIMTPRSARKWKNSPWMGSETNHSPPLSPTFLTWTQRLTLCSTFCKVAPPSSLPQPCTRQEQEVAKV
jgi:hypothetical protein